MNDKREPRPEGDAEKIKAYEAQSRVADTGKKASGGAGKKPAKKAGKKADRKLENEMAAKLEAAGKEAGENYDRFLRISAEFENYKKRKDRETTDFRKYANETLVKALLPVVDNLQRATETPVDDDAGSVILEGVDMTLKEIFRVLENFAVKAVEAVGNQFDPAYHQAVMQEETQEHPDNTVIRELQKGYTIHDRLLRPSMVVVAKAVSE